MQAIVKQPQRCRSAQLENDDPCGLPRWETRDVPEVAIKRNQGAALGDTDLKDAMVGTAAKSLLANGRYVMAAVTQEIDAADANVLIGLDFHSAGSTGTGMTRSRAASAP